MGMYFIIEYVDTVTGIEGESLSWEFAKTEAEATIKARAHLLLFKARFGAQGYRILSPAGSLVACGPGTQEQHADGSVAIELRPNGDYGEARDRLFPQGLHDSEDLGWRSPGQSSPFVYSKSILARAANGTALRTEPPSSKSSLRGKIMPDSLRSMPQILPDSAESKACTSLAGKRILVVEDDGLIALDIVCELRRAGCTAIGSAARLETAMSMAAAQQFDAAVLDVFLDGAYAWQLAETLKAQGVPFLFQTGFSRFLDFPAEFASVPCLEKPMMTGALKRELKALLD